MNNEYATFEPLPLTPAEILQKSLKQKDMLEQIKNIVKTLGDVIKLQSDYLNCSSYYYNSINNVIYEIENVTAELRIPPFDVETHLRELNNIKSRTVEQ